MLREVARRAGLRRSAIRYYEQIGLLPQAARVSGQRRYDSSVLTRLSIIELAQRAGFTLAETRTLLDGFAPDAPPSERWQALARQKLSDVDALIERANGMRRLLQEGLRAAVRVSTSASFASRTFRRWELGRAPSRCRYSAR